MKVREIIKATGGRLISGVPGTDIDPLKISTDSRIIKKGGFFIALKGPNFDGGRFVRDVFCNGAIGALVEDCNGQDAERGKVIIQVKDTTKALRDIAAYHRMKFRIPVIVITGSNGKTSVKEMVWSVLSKKYRVLKNEGTKNNHIGVPQTLLQLKRGHDICVLELGTNHAGEIRALGDLAKPTISVITNIGASHLEFFGDLEGVYKAKAEVLESLGAKGLGVLNGDDELLSRVSGRKFRIIRFGIGETNDFRAGAISTGKNKVVFTLNGEYEFTLNLLGIHNVYNAMAAIAIARHFKIGYKDIKKSLSDYRPVYMRLDVNKVGGIDIINDAYNSNPSSMKRALEVIRCYPARAKWIVSADMLELGTRGVRFHKMVGEDVAGLGVEGLLTFGELSKYTSIQAMACGMDRDRLWHCSTRDEVASILKKRAKKGDVILLKGSRGMKMEEVLDKFKERA